MKQGTSELIFLGIFFLGLQIWWISTTIKNGRTGEVEKWNKKTSLSLESKIEKTKQDLEKIFRS